MKHKKINLMNDFFETLLTEIKYFNQIYLFNCDFL